MVFFKWQSIFFHMKADCISLILIAHPFNPLYFYENQFLENIH